MSKLNDKREILSKPGDTILETIEYLGMSQVELSERMGKTPAKVNDLISGKEPITLNTAFQLEKVLGIDAQFWLNREMIYREKLLRIEQEEALEEYRDWLNIQPIKELKNLGYIKSKKSTPAMVEECLKFYGVATPDQWESVYINHRLTSSFRKSNVHKTALGSVAAFLRIGEIEGQKISSEPYDKKNFKKGLEEIKNLIRIHPADFAIRLQEICRAAGVILVYTAKLPNAPISGVARWISGNPLIQLTDRFKTNDQFWFSFFHEAGHILLHGKKEIFIEDNDQNEVQNKKEFEANQFANEWLLPEKLLDELPENITEKDIRRIARSHNTHPAIVLGHLQHLKLLPFSFGNHLKLKVVLNQFIKKS